MENEQLPAGWAERDLMEVLDKIVGGGTPSKGVPAYFAGSIPLMTVKDMKVSRPSSTGFNITEAALQSSSAKVVPADTVIIATRMGLGKVVRPKMDTAINQDLKALFPSAAIEKSYLEWWLRSIAHRIDAMGTGTTVKGVRLTEIKALKVPLPPRPEQERIVEKVETLFAELDKSEEALRQVQKLLARYHQSILKAAVSGRLTADWRMQGERWTRTTLGELNSLLTSGSRGWAKYYAGSGDIFIRAQNLKHDRLELEDVAFVDLPRNSEGTRTKVAKGDILITITGANVTKTGLVEQINGTAYVSQHVALFRPKAEVFSPFLHHFLMAKAGGRNQLEKAAYGAGKPGLNLQNIKDVHISLPPYEEQVEVVDRVERLLGGEHAVAIEIERQYRIVKSLRQSILKDAFSGKLVPQDPSDEPAEKLLQRVRAARVVKLKPTRGKAIV
jgi:type I restriction enzyme S subunit